MMASPGEDSPSMMALWSATVTFDEQIEKEKGRRPSEVSALEEMREFVKKRLYHQFLETASTYFEKETEPASPMFPSSETTQSLPPPAAFLLYIIGPYHAKANPTKVIRLVSRAAAILEASDALRLIRRFDIADSEAKYLTESLTAYHLVRNGSLKEAESILEAIDMRLDSELGVDVSVHAAVHRSWAALAKAQVDDDNFYKQALLYLAYTPMADIPHVEALPLAVNLSIAALTAQTVHSFGELIQHPLLSKLREAKEYGWLVTLLTACMDGQLSVFEETWGKHLSEIRSYPNLSLKEDILRRKLVRLAFLDLAFQRPKQKLRFTDVAQHCNVPLDQVELIVMESMSNGLVKGKIDEVAGVISITWVQPRILDNSRLTIMKTRLDAWSMIAGKLLARLKSEAPELTFSAIS